MFLIGLVGIVFAGRRVDELLTAFIEGCCADCGYALGRSVFHGQCPECGAWLIRSKQRDRWMAVYRARNLNAMPRQSQDLPSFSAYEFGEASSGSVQVPDR